MVLHTRRISKGWLKPNYRSQVTLTLTRGGERSTNTLNSTLVTLGVFSQAIYSKPEKDITRSWGFPDDSARKEPAYNAGDMEEDAGSIPGSGRSPGEENGNPLQYSCLESPTDRGLQTSLQSMESQRVGHDWTTKHNSWKYDIPQEHMNYHIITYKSIH